MNETEQKAHDILVDIEASIETIMDIALEEVHGILTGWDGPNRPEFEHEWQKPTRIRDRLKKALYELVENFGEYKG